MDFGLVFSLLQARTSDARRASTPDVIVPPLVTLGPADSHGNAFRRNGPLDHATYFNAPLDLRACQKEVRTHVV